MFVLANFISLEPGTASGMSPRSHGLLTKIIVRLFGSGGLPDPENYFIRV